MLLSVRDQYFKRPIKEEKIELGIDRSAVKVQSTIIKKHLKGLNRIHILKKKKKNTRMDVCLGARNEDSSSALLSLATDSRAFDHETPSGRRPSGWRLGAFTF